MGRFKQLLTDLQNNDSEMIELIHDVSEHISKKYSKEYSKNFQGIDYNVEEILLYGYIVNYLYRKAKEIVKNDDGSNGEMIYAQMRIVSIVEPLSQKIVSDSSIEKLIHDKLVEIIDNKAY